MLILDTDHFSEFFRGSKTGEALQQQLATVDDDVVLTIVTAEELTRGWLAQIARAKSAAERQLAYDQFGILLSDLAHWTVLPWSAEAEQTFAALRRAGVRIGTLDLRIASIALTHDAVLLTRNAKDFGKVPLLRNENWL